MCYSSYTLRNTLHISKKTLPPFLLKKSYLPFKNTGLAPKVTVITPLWHDYWINEEKDGLGQSENPDSLKIPLKKCGTLTAFIKLNLISVMVFLMHAVLESDHLLGELGITITVRGPI